MLMQSEERPPVGTPPGDRIQHKRHGNSRLSAMVGARIICWRDVRPVRAIDVFYPSPVLLKTVEKP
jgi:hypothetical protein